MIDAEKNKKGLGKMPHNVILGFDYLNERGKVN